MKRKILTLTLIFTSAAAIAVGQPWVEIIHITAEIFSFRQAVATQLRQNAVNNELTADLFTKSGYPAIAHDFTVRAAAMRDSATLVETFAYTTSQP